MGRRVLVLGLAVGAAIAIVVLGLHLRSSGREARVRAATAIYEKHDRKVVVYTAEGCGVCRMAKTHMQARGIDYVERKVDQDDDARAEFASLGGRSVVPTFVVGNEVLVGFDPRGVMLDRARARLTAAATD